MNAMEEWLEEKTKYLAIVRGRAIGRSSNIEGACRLIWNIGGEVLGEIWDKDCNKVADVFKGEVVQIKVFKG